MSYAREFDLISKLVVIAFLFGSFGAVTTQASAAGSEKSKLIPASLSEWHILGGNANAWQYSDLAQINDRNVHRLGLAWVAEMGSVDGLVGNPLVADGVVYQSGPPGRIYANDVRTGELIWTFNPDVRISDNQSFTAFWALHFNRGLALHEENLYVASNCRILAVNRTTRKQTWAAQSCDPDKGYGITGAPRVGGGKVFIGNASGDMGADRGYIDAFNATTGSHMWRFYTMPGDPSKPFENQVLAMAAKSWGTDYWQYTHGSVSPWEAITYDETSDTLYFGTDGPAPWVPTGRAPDAGDELFSNSIIAVNAATGEYLWHYQTVQNDGWNLAATMHIMLADLPLRTGTRRVVMTAPKNGFFYVLDAKTGELISARNYVPVNWASHIDQVSGRPVTLPEARYWERPNEEIVVLPGDIGGHSWQLMAFLPRLNLVYIPATIAPITMKSDQGVIGGVDIDYYYGFRSDAKVKSKGSLVAWDPIQQQERWYADRTLPINGGILATGGNLVFQGTGDGKFEAFDAETGRRLWSFETKSTIIAAPTTVEIDGRQLIIVPSGNGGSAAMRGIPRLMNNEQTLAPARLLAFSLDAQGTLPLNPFSPFPRPARQKQPDEIAVAGARLFDVNGCGVCHGRFAVGSGPGISDLRKMSEETHAIFREIVIGGLLRSVGMPSYPDLKNNEIEAIRAYLINQGWTAFEKQQIKTAPRESL